MENNRDNFEQQENIEFSEDRVIFEDEIRNSRREIRRQAIRRRNIFIALCVVILVLAIALIGFIVFAVTSGDKTKSDSSAPDSSYESTAYDSSVNSSSVESNMVSSQDAASKEDNSSVDSTIQNIYDEYDLDPDYSRLLLVNGENPLPEDYDYEGNLMLIEDKYLCGWRNQLDADVMPYATAMIEAAWEDGVELYILSPYRSYETQSSLFEAEVQECMAEGLSRQKAEEKAATVVARPGTSEHHTGLAIDFNSVEDSFEDTEMYEWLAENAQDYGFILRYTAEKQSITGVIHESWHWRFVGINEAKKIKASGLCLEEYLESANNDISE